MHDPLALAAQATMTRTFCGPRPTIVCLCGSTRFFEQFAAANLSETLAGRIVLSKGCETKSDVDLVRAIRLNTEVRARLDELHLRKVELADEVLVINVDGYIGESTALSVAHAVALGKPVRYLVEPSAP